MPLTPCAYHTFAMAWGSLGAPVGRLTPPKYRPPALDTATHTARWPPVHPHTVSKPVTLAFPYPQSLILGPTSTSGAASSFIFYPYFQVSSSRRARFAQPRAPGALPTPPSHRAQFLTFLVSLIEFVRPCWLCIILGVLVHVLSPCGRSGKVQGSVVLILFEPSDRMGEGRGGHIF